MITDSTTSICSGSEVKPALTSACCSCSRPAGAARMAANWVSWTSHRTAPAAKSQGSHRSLLPGGNSAKGLDTTYIRGYNLGWDTTYRSQRLSRLSPTAQRQAGGPLHESHPTTQTQLHQPRALLHQGPEASRLRGRGHDRPARSRLRRAALDRQVRE